MQQGTYADGNKTAPVSQSLPELLEGLAGCLLKAGITPKQFTDLATRAFVDAASDTSRMRNGRVNHSRVAVLTGLNRRDIRRIVAGVRATSAGQQPRTQRVINAWRSDESYLDASGRPLALRADGSRSRFASLVRKSAGDVPYTAVLAELRRTKAVRESDDLVYLSDTATQAPSALPRSLSSALSVAIDAIRIASAAAKPLSSLPVFRREFVIADARDLDRLRKRIHAGASLYVSALQKPLRGNRTSSTNSRRRVTVTVLVREHKFSRTDVRGKR
jgi:hypothetical protein